MGCKYVDEVFGDDPRSPSSPRAFETLTTGPGAEGRDSRALGVPVVSKDRDNTVADRESGNSDESSLKSHHRCLWFRHRRFGTAD